MGGVEDEMVIAMSDCVEIAVLGYSPRPRPERVLEHVTRPRWC